eukprot:46020-Eustigmatos_ZCMA.PRE.1
MDSPSSPKEAKILLELQLYSVETIVLKHSRCGSEAVGASLDIARRCVLALCWGVFPYQY